MVEKCLNPFQKTKCGNVDIVLYIEYKGEKLPICKKCADKLLESDIEWGEKDGKNT